MAPFVVVTTRAPYNEATVLKKLGAVPAEAFFRRHFGHAGAAVDVAPPAIKIEAIPKPPATDPKKGPDLPPKQFNNDGAQVGDPPPKAPAKVERADKIDAIDFGELYFREHSQFALFLLDKPEGLTSHDVVERVRAATGVSRISHSGTLDPMATGLLLLCAGVAARLQSFFTLILRR